MKAAAEFDPRLPSYLPPDAVKLTSWQDMHEALRSRKIIQEQPIVQELMGGIMTFLDGPHHVLRRRVMKSLVRPAQLSSYRKAAEPALRDTMAELVRPNAQSRPGCDLVDLLHQTFVRLGAAMISRAYRP